MGKEIISVIKYEGPNDVLIWKHPTEDFNLGTQLIVHESQEAIFFRDGKALDLFGAGRHTLTTQKLPLLDKIYKIPTGGEELFHTEVYYVNTVFHTNVKWGTDSKVRMFDPISGLVVELGASGEFTLKVSDSRKLLIKLVGTTNSLKTEDIVDTNSLYNVKVLTGKFRALVVSKVKSILSRIIKENNINILEVDAHVEEIGNALKAEINEVFDEYGLYIPEFYVNNIATPDDDPNFRKLKEQYAEKYLRVKDEQIKKDVALAEQQRRIVEAQTGAQEEIIKAQAQAEAYRLKAQAEAQEMQMKGYTYQQETQRHVGVGAVENMGKGGGSGGAAGGISDVVGLGVTLGALGGVVNVAKDAMKPVVEGTKEMSEGVASSLKNGWTCPSCGKAGITTKFCPECGTPKPAQQVGWACPNCGTINTGKFCTECGTKKPETNSTWDCECGEKNITSKFCPNCGKKKGE